ncbi:hypothetical protein U2T78_004554 [Providencia stuartii]|uniref:MoxR family ATPase n=3 Tax=Enterobacterales TaxID=91347 RepID=A0A385EN09_ECOLX|nr:MULTISPECIES: hypothetical protein [Providencia]AND15060.1 hypothetical protein AOUC001_20110 [Proteus mirabilis]AOO34797.1 hypothetical protein [Klebsiella pneumoniae]AXQ86730.1 MoxR family ATPase [Escherichia coli]EYB80286.1 hypothetical protein KPB1_5474 [Klebsiella pneumoniae Kb140]MCL8327464.1 hypothetical protein [Providencia thailandensis]WHO54271.1 hypothetical protein [Citrobacter freundii]
MGRLKCTPVVITRRAPQDWYPWRRRLANCRERRRHRQCSTENRSHGSAAQTPSLNVTVVGNPCRPQGRRWWANR